MAEQRNYYEIIDTLDFDPIEKNKSKIEKAIELWKSKAEQYMGLEDAMAEQIREELKLYNDIKKCLNDENERKKAAEEMLQKQKKKLDGIIALLKEGGDGGGLFISDTRIRSIAKSLRLNYGTVEKAFNDAKIENISRKPKDIPKDIPISDTSLDEIDKKVKKLSSTSSKEFPWLSKVRDLYDLAAYFKEDGANAGKYPSKSATELKQIMEDGSTSIRGKYDELNLHGFGELYSAGSTKIFKDENTKRKYDNFLKLKKLDDILFFWLKEIPKEMRKDAYIADPCIRKIQSYFPDPDVALAIYNAKASIMNDPYKPDSEKVEYVCAKCKSVMKIQYGWLQYDKEKRECKCKLCGAPLFEKCEKCSRLIMAVADICPECGFNRIESKFFDRYFVLAQSAAEVVDIAEAKKQLALAKNARPNDPKLETLEAEIDKAAQRYGKPLDKIRNLMNQGLYMQANKQMEKFCADYPNVKVDGIKAQIDRVIADADRRFAQRQSHSDPCGACYDILDIVKDYTKALEFIKGKRPTAVTGLTANVSAKSGQVTLQWAGTGERHVSYRVVRKESEIPQNSNDGVVILNNQLATQYIDSSVSVGVIYYYAVFAEREGTYSTPAASKACILLQELDEKNFVKNAKEGKCILIWQRPKNCRGVRILRSEKGRAAVQPGKATKVIAECARDSYEDGAVANGTKYDYRLQCVYDTETGVQYSEGIVFSLMPDSRPMSVTLVSISAKSGDMARITWDYTHDIRNSRMDLYDMKPGIQVAKGMTYPIGELTKLGTKLKTVSDPSAKASELLLPQKRGYRLCAVTVKGEYAAVSNCISCSNYEKIDIDRERTKISRSDLLICLKEDFPQGITGIRYTVATKKSDSDPAPWRGMEDVQEMTLLPVSTYRSDKVIMIREVPRDVLYISVVGEYRVGKEVYYSEPSHLRLSNLPKAEISYRIAWGLLGQKKNVKLIIECDRDTDLPEMQLCCSRTVEIPMSMNNGDIIRLCRIPEHINYMAHTRKEIEIPNEVWRGVASGHEMRLFVLDDRVAEFYMKPDGKSLRIP